MNLIYFSIIQVTKMHQLSYIILEQNIETNVVVCRWNKRRIILSFFWSSSSSNFHGRALKTIFLEI